jgi:hypothetical protein
MTGEMIVFLQDLCANHDVVFIQEHWLLSNNLDVINSWNTDWYCRILIGVNGIENYALKGGRLYGGVDFM